MLALKEIKALQKDPKARHETGLFIVEGIKMFRETPPELIEQICLSESFTKEHGDEIVTRIGRERFQKIAETIPDGRMEKLSDTRSPQGVLLVVRQKVWETDAVLNKEAPLIILLEDVQDPGNVGTILRTAEAAGVNGVFMTEGCADIYNPKTIRSTMGAVYRVPHFRLSDPDELLMRCLERDIISYAAYLDTANTYLDGDYKRGTLFFIGNESRGLSEELLNKADRLIKIPMQGEIESLNAAMAAGILMYEAARQRR